jgi:23S rRNA (guanosine2251-2'-O)-methyltransferase
MKKKKPQPRRFERPPRERERPEREAPRVDSSRLVVGVAPVLEVLRSGSRRIERIVVAEGAREHRISEIIATAREKGILFRREPRESLDKLVEAGANHQGVAAVVSAAEYADAEALVERIAGREGSLTLVLDGVEDPRNLGALLRTAECAGVEAVFIPEHRAAGLTETVVKTSAGATEHVNVAKARNLNRLIEELKSNNIWVVGTDGDATMDYTDWDWTRSTALVMGSEGRGLHRLVAENCDALVRIPLAGRIGSLNVAVAAGVVLFEALRQRRSVKK